MFGPIVVVGAGGTLVELLGDKVIAACLITEAEAAALLRGTVIARTDSTGPTPVAARINQLALRFG